MASFCVRHSLRVVLASLATGELTLRRDKLIRIPVYEDIILFPLQGTFATVARLAGLALPPANRGERERGKTITLPLRRIRGSMIFQKKAYEAAMATAPG